MTTDKYQSHQCPLEERVKGIEKDIQEIKGMVAGMYDSFSGLVDTAEATYKTVSYRTSGTPRVSEDDWGFLDEDE